MPRNLEATKAKTWLVWSHFGSLYVSFPTLPRAFIALERLFHQGHAAEYDGQTSGRYWIRLYTPPRA
jgi:hypothetical protein